MTRSPAPILWIALAATLALPSIPALTQETLGIGRDCSDALGPGPGCHEWSTRLTSPGQQGGPVGGFLSPDGRTLYAWGTFGGSVPEENVRVAALDLETGALLWAFERDGPAEGHHAIHEVSQSPDGARIYVAGALAARRVEHEWGHVVYSDAFVLAIDAATGSLAWEFAVPSFEPEGGATATTLGVTAGGSSVWAIVHHGAGNASNATLVSLDATSGAPVFSTPSALSSLWGGIEIQPGAPGEMLVWSSDGDDIRIDARDADDGRLLRSASVPYDGLQPWDQRVLRRGDGALFLASSWGTTLRRIDPHDLSVVWETSVGSRNHFLDHRAALSPDGAMVYVAGFQPYAVRAVDAETGEILWTWLAPDEATISGVTATSDGLLLAGRWNPTLSLDTAPAVTSTTSRTAAWELGLDGAPRWMGTHNQRADAAWGTASFPSPDGRAVTLGTAKGAQVDGGAWTLDAFRRS